MATVTDSAGKRLYKFLMTASKMELNEPGRVPILDKSRQLAGYVTFADNRFMLNVVDIIRKTEAFLAATPPSQQPKGVYEAMAKLHLEMGQDEKDAVTAPTVNEHPHDEN